VMLQQLAHEPSLNELTDDCRQGRLAAKER
jgi:hypothetical protein